MCLIKKPIVSSFVQRRSARMTDPHSSFRAVRIQLWPIYLQLVLSSLLNNREAEQTSFTCVAAVKQI